MLNKILAVVLFALSFSVFAASGDELIQPGKATPTVVKLQCEGGKIVVTNVEPYPKGCVVVSTSKYKVITIEKGTK